MKVSSGTQVLVAKLPKCDFCDQLAKYDAASRQGLWGYFCPVHFHQYTDGVLGRGRGQELITKETSK
jgi:hypothetical protein